MSWISNNDEKIKRWMQEDNEAPKVPKSAEDAAKSVSGSANPSVKVRKQIAAAVELD